MPPAAIAGGVAVVIDVIRASTTITAALANAAAGVFPVESVEQAKRKAAILGPATLLGGERGGVRIEGFHLGNSPRDYTSERVADHQIVFTTTNGTAALAACQDAAVVLIGSLVNCTAVAEAARAAAVEHQAAVHLVCAGVERRVADEDLLGAGAIVAAAERLFPADTFDDDAKASRQQFLEASGLQDGTPATAALAASLNHTEGGRRIIALGMQDDLPVVAALDSLTTVPALDRERGILLPLPNEQTVMDPSRPLRLHSRP
jgi:2-phosphosulfolactate phosphatase